MRFLHLFLAIVLAMGVLIGLGGLIGLPPAVAAPAATIQSMIDAAPDGGTVNIAAGTYTESLTVNRALTLTGVSSSTTIINAVTGQRVISTTGSDLRLQNLTLTGGHVVTDSGGGVLVISGSLTLNNCRIVDNLAAAGGGVYQFGAGGRVDVINSQIERNTALSGGGGGGGLLTIYSDVWLTNTRVSSNTTGGFGGGLAVWGWNLTLMNAQIISNTANGDGGGLAVGGGITMTNAQVLSNTANGDGGGLFAVGGNVNVSGGLIGSNRASNGNGGGLQQADAAYTVTLANTRFEQNAAFTFGGGASVSGTLIISHSTFATNTVDTGPITTTMAAGGGVYAVGPTQISASTFVSNTARAGLSLGGGVVNNKSLTIQDSTFERNTAFVGGGVYGPYITVTRSTFTGNAASFGGGGAFGVVLTITQSTFTRNTAPTGGGVAGGELVQAAESTFTANQASTGGGGLYGQYAILTNTRFISNTAGSGGGVQSLIVDAVNTLFADNQAVGGAAIDTVMATLRHVTIAGATLRDLPAIQATSGLVAITDTIVSNYSIAISQTGGLLNADYNLFFTATPTQTSGVTVTWGTHYLNADPKFVNPSAGNYHLAPGSPAIDSGIAADVMTDLDGQPRPMGHGYDLGAYEARPPLYLPLILRH